MTTITKGYAATSAGQLHYRRAGASGAPVLLFHRTPVTSASFSGVLENLGQSRDLIAFDTPGFGESFTPAPTLDMHGFIAAFIEAIDALGIDRFHLVGHHTGAHFAAELAARYPRRALSLMMDGAMVPSDEERARVLPPIPETVVDEDGTYALNAWKFVRPYYTVFDGRCMHDEFVGAMHSTFTRQACMKVVRAHDVAAVLARVTCPVLASAAEDDVFIGHMERISSVLPQAATRVYGAAGIASPELQTETFCALIRESIAAGEA